MSSCLVAWIFKSHFNTFQKRLGKEEGEQEGGGDGKEGRKKERGLWKNFKK